MKNAKVKTLDLEQIKGMAEEQGWKVFKHTPEQNLIRFVRDDSMIDFWYSKKMTVGVYQKGCIAKFHRRVTERDWDTVLSEN